MSVVQTEAEITFFDNQNRIMKMNFEFVVPRQVEACIINGFPFKTVSMLLIMLAGVSDPAMVTSRSARIASNR